MWAALLMTAAGVAPGAALPVRLAPVTCPAFTDVALRAALRVEVRDRLMAEAAPAPADFALVSVACVGDDASLLIVRQGGGTPARRQVPLSEVVTDARPRAVAIAVAELLRVDLARNEPPPTAAAALQTASSTIAPARPAMAIALSGTPLLLGGYFASGTGYWFSGLQLRVAFETPIEPVPGRAWGFGVALGLDGHGPSGVDRFSVTGEVSVLLRRQGPIFSYELGLGGRFGRTWDYKLAASPPSANLVGVLGSLAVERVISGRSFSRLAVEAGADSGPLGGRWARLVLAGGLRF